MLKETITYTDYNDVTRTEDFYFNISRAEAIEMEMSVDGGYTAMINRISTEMSGPKIMETFKNFIVKAYGVKSPDGKQFIKSEELTQAFLQSEAYSELMVKLMSGGEEKAAAFINGIMPKTDSVKVVN